MAGGAGHQGMGQQPGLANFNPNWAMQHPLQPKAIPAMGRGPKPLGGLAGPVGVGSAGGSPINPILAGLVGKPMQKGY